MPRYHKTRIRRASVECAPLGARYYSRLAHGFLFMKRKTQQSNPLKRTPQEPRIRFESFDCFDENGKNDGDGLEKIISIFSRPTIGMGFAPDGTLVGWRYRERYRLTLRDSIEWFLAMRNTDAILNCGSTWDDENERKWLGMVWKAIPESGAGKEAVGGAQ